MDNLTERIEKLKAWIAALRSGEYTQGRHHLAFTAEGSTSYCCLGVACEIAKLERVVNRDVPGVYAYKWEVTNKAGEVIKGEEDSILPPPLANEQAYPEILSAIPSLSVISANDAGKLNFKEIADVLESVYLGDGTKAEEVLVAMYGKDGYIFEEFTLVEMRRGFGILKNEFIAGTM